MSPSKQGKENFTIYKDFEVNPYTTFDCIDSFLMKYEIKVKAVYSLNLGQEDALMVHQASSLFNTRYSNRIWC